MTDKEMEDYLDRYKRENDEAVPLSKLLKSFEGFQPVYSPRRPPKDPRAAEQAAKTRAFIRLVELFEKAPDLTKKPGEASLDIKELAIELGYLPPKRMMVRLPDYKVVLDREFFKFVQGLPPSIGGSKKRSSAEKEPSEELKEFRAALDELRGSRSEAAKKFMEVYDRLQSKLRLPKA